MQTNPAVEQSKIIRWSKSLWNQSDRKGKGLWNVLHAILLMLQRNKIQNQHTKKLVIHTIYDMLKTNEHQANGAQEKASPEQKVSTLNGYL